MINSISEIVRHTIQPHGFHAGTPCSMIRLAQSPGFGVVAKELQQVLHNEWVVLKGRDTEALTHPDIDAVLHLLRGWGKRVILETNGTVEFDLRKVANCWKVLTPKEHLGTSEVKENFWERANEVIITIRDEEDFKHYEDRLCQAPHKQEIWLQPFGMNPAQESKEIMFILEKYFWFKFQPETRERQVYPT